MSRTRIGSVLFDPATGELLWDDRAERLRPLAAHALALLVERAGELVPRQDLRTALWPAGGTDADLGLNVCIRQIRVALGDDHESPTYIETLRGRGYRLIAPVEAEPAAAGPERERGRRRFGRPTVGRWTAAALAAASLFVFVALAMLDRDAPRVAVVPFRVDGATTVRPDLGEVVAESVIASLAVHGPDQLAVIARTSSFDLTHDGLGPLEVGGELGADYVIDGVFRRTPLGDEISVQLLDVASGTYAWSDRFDADSSALGRVEESIVAAIRTSLGVPAMEPDRFVADADPRVRTELLRARYLIDLGTPDGAARAVTALDRALALDSTWAPTWVERAHALLASGNVDAAVEAVERARTLAPDVPGADYAAGRIELYGHGDPWRAVAHLGRAARREPGAARVRRAYAQALAATGRSGAAVREGRLALDLDPVSSSVRGDVGWVFYYARRFDLARSTCRAALELMPTSVLTHACVILAAHFQGDLPTERDVVARFLALLAAAPADSAAVLAAVGSGDPRPLWTWVLENRASVQLEEVGQARVLSLLGERRGATDALVRAVEADRRALALSLADPLFDESRTSPAFLRAAEAAGLAAPAPQHPPVAPQ